jgi:hypothetical protein
MAENDAEDEKPDAAETRPHLQTEDQKGAGPINDPGSGVGKEDGSDDSDNMGRA